MWKLKSKLTKLKTKLKNFTKKEELLCVIFFTKQLILDNLIFFILNYFFCFSGFLFIFLSKFVFLFGLYSSWLILILIIKIWILARDFFDEFMVKVIFIVFLSCILLYFELINLIYLFWIWFIILNNYQKTILNWR